MSVPVQLQLCIILVSVILPVCRAGVCCFPKQWEGNLEILIPGTSGVDMFTEINVDMSFDITGQRIRQYIPATGLLQLFFFKEGVGYMIENSTCSKGTIGPMPSSLNCVPDGAKFLRNYQLGMKYKMNFTDYMFITSIDRQDQTQTVRTVTDMCVPVEDKVVANASYPATNNAMYTITFENITPGIKDPAVFDVPSICKESARKMKRPTGWNHFEKYIIHG